MSSRPYRLPALIVAATALLCAQQVAIVSSSGASTTSTTASVAHSASSGQAWSAWRSTWIAYLATLRSINRTYRSEVASANAAFNVQMEMATSRSARDVAREKFDAALERANMNRVAATSALGSPPTPPAGTTTATVFATVVKNANAAFQLAIVNAQHAYSLAVSTATTTEQRTAAVLTLKTAIDNAVITRSSIFSALGVPRTLPRH